MIPYTCINDSAILRLHYKRNTVDVDEAVNQLKSHTAPIRAVIMTATARPLTTSSEPIVTERYATSEQPG